MLAAASCSLQRRSYLLPAHAALSVSSGSSGKAPSAAGSAASPPHQTVTRGKLELTPTFGITEIRPILKLVESTGRNSRDDGLGLHAHFLQHFLQPGVLLSEGYA